MARLSGHTFDETRTQLERTLGEVGVRAPDSVSQWGSALGLLYAVRSTLSVFHSQVFQEEIPFLIAAAAPRSWRQHKGIQMSWGQCRRFRKRARKLWRARKPKRAELHRALIEADGQRRVWERVRVDQGLPRLPADLDGPRGAHDQLNDELSALGTYVATASAEQVGELAPAVASQRLRELTDDRDTLLKMPRMSQLHQRLQEYGLGSLLAELTDRRVDASMAVAAFDYAWYESLLSHIGLEDSLYGSSNYESITRAAVEFQEADRKHIAATAGRIQTLLTNAYHDATATYSSEGTLLRREANKKAKHKRVRELVEQAEESLLKLKPCWAMSPLVVSQTLPAARIFDVVIFDEASQIPVPDAIPSIMRAGQVVVAGDRHQLPPTVFFSEADTDEEEKDEEGTEVDCDAAVSLATGHDSILEALTPLRREKSLTWHYRSRDERLITFANRVIYDSSLTTFPGIARETCLRHELVDQTPAAGQEQSVYGEVEEVVRLVLEHAHSRPAESLGVIAMNIKHANRIESALWAALAEERDLDKFFSQEVPEAFFVKNLERVQGDERDAIILSTGYGRSVSTGRMSYRFGPLNQEGGHRRLNVAVTRAKRRMTLVTSFSSYDLDPARLRSKGAQLLRSYLQYMESGGSSLGSLVTDHAELNPFEIDVRDRLAAAGIPLIPQYGVGDYRIDFAARHPQQRGRMVLAIEADGASYHSTPTARDRDRLRQEHLESLGWSFHRIWSTAWFKDAAGQVEEICKAYESAVAAADAAVTTPTSPEGERTGSVAPVPGPSGNGDSAGSRALRETATRLTESTGDAGVVPVQKVAPQARMASDRGPRPNVPRNRPINDYGEQELLALARWIDADGVPRSHEDLVRAMMEDLGFERRGSRIRARLGSAADAVLRSASSARQQAQAPQEEEPSKPVQPLNGGKVGSAPAPHPTIVQPPAENSRPVRPRKLISEALPSAGATPLKQRPRISPRAYRRVLHESNQIKQWLAAEHHVSAVDRAAAEAERREYQRTRDRFVERLNEIESFLTRARIDEDGSKDGIAWPGCIVACRFDDEEATQCFVISSIPDDDHVNVRPHSPLGEALAGALVGHTYTYDTPEGRRRVSVTGIYN